MFIKSHDYNFQNAKKTDPASIEMENVVEKEAEYENNEVKEPEYESENDESKEPEYENECYEE